MRNTEEVVKYEAAVLLRHIGFPQRPGDIEEQYRPSTGTCYFTEDGRRWVGLTEWQKDPNKCFTAPTQEIALRWLRKQKKTAIFAYIVDIDANGDWLWGYQVYKGIKPVMKDGKGYPTPEKALDEALRETCHALYHQAI